MQLLIDTHVFLWMQSDPGRFGSTTRSLIEGQGTTLFLSAASSWEIAIKYAIGRLSLPEPPSAYVPSRMSASAVTGLPIEHAHALAVENLDLHHRDPFDRMLVAQAKTDGLTILTADRKLEPYPVDIRWASE
jgi:PIN domain nuclease of toxin-antitoxin system